MKRLNHARVLMYSHDTFGLGHLRRTRTIAHALVERFKGLSVLIVSGSPIAGAFDFRARVDFVKIPSVIKLYNGEYQSLDRHIDLKDTLALRQAIIQHTATIFRPDVFIADKEPLGLRGELASTLPVLRDLGTTTVLGLRDVLDSPEQVREEWSKKNVAASVARYYDRIWVYGPQDFWNPLTGLDLPEAVLGRMHYTGFLMREEPQGPTTARRIEAKGYLLVTAGGGGDGSDLMHQVLSAYEAEPRLGARPLVMVLGPFMSVEERRRIRRQATRVENVTVLDFHNRMETLIKDAKAIVSMCGYNTFCEILSFDKRALVVPRKVPREEQLIRARRACEMGVVDFVDPEAADDPAVLARALLALPTRRKPSQVDRRLQLEGLDAIAKLVSRDFRETRGASLTPN